MTRRRARLPAEAVSLIVFASVIVIETLAGRMRPWFTPDSARLAIQSWPACLGGQRIPLYGWIVNAVFGMTGGYGLIPWLQAAAYGAAMFYFLRGLPVELFGRRARLALGLALAFSNVLLIWICALVPCVLGVAALIAPLTEVVALADGERPSRRSCALACSKGLPSCFGQGCCRRSEPEQCWFSCWHGCIGGAGASQRPWRCLQVFYHFSW